MGIDLNIEIDRTRTAGTFTNYDVISGIVKLTNTSSLSLAYIQVKLEGLSHTQMFVPLRRKKKEHEKHMITDTHKVLYDSHIVFPPENVRKVSLAKEFTLTPGTYTYPFLFRIPLKSGCLKGSAGRTSSFGFPSNAVDINVGNLLNVSGLKATLNQLLQGAQQGPDLAHFPGQLPPSLLSMGHSASIRYFIKVTCNRASIFKTNVRATDPFNFLPLDLDDHFQPLMLQEEEYREVYFRKDITFKNRIPQVVAVKMDEKSYQRPPMPQQNSKKGFFSSFFTPPSPPVPPEKPRRTNSGRLIDIHENDVNFAFEIRFRHPAILSPTNLPRFKLFFVSNEDPSNYSLAQYGKPQESNGLGVVYLQKLKFDLVVVTNISVVDKDYGAYDVHRSRSEDVIPICNNTYKDLPLDLMNSKKQKSLSASSNGFVALNSYELEIPRKYYENFKLPRDLAPTFKTCNIERTYSLMVVAGVSSEKIGSSSSRPEADKRIKFIDLLCPNIKVLSGLKMTEALHSNALNPSFGTNQEGDARVGDYKPPLPHKNSEKSRNSVGSVEDSSLPLPTYEDVVRENSYQDNSEHLRARHRYGN